MGGICDGSANATATVKGNTTAKQDADAQASLLKARPASEFDAGRPAMAPPKPGEAPRTAAAYVTHQADYQGFDVKPPPDAPDATDDLIRKRRAAAASQAMLGRGRAGTFLDGPQGGDLGMQTMLGGKKNA